VSLEGFLYPHSMQGEAFPPVKRNLCPGYRCQFPADKGTGMPLGSHTLYIKWADRFLVLVLQTLTKC